ncbi:hypothetical protein Tco_1164525 [Tanacetum coccineum]
MSDLEHSTVSYVSISSDSDPSAWGIPLMDAGELPEMDPYEEHHVSVYASEPVYLEYLVLSDDDIPVEDPKEDLEEDPIDYAANANGDEDEEEESSEDDDDKEEEYLAPADSTAIASPVVNHVPSATPIPFLSEAEVVRLLALPIPPPSPLTPLSSPLP